MCGKAGGMDGVGLAANAEGVFGRKRSRVEVLPDAALSLSPPPLSLSLSLSHLSALPPSPRPPLPPTSLSLNPPPSPLYCLSSTHFLSPRPSFRPYAIRSPLSHYRSYQLPPFLKCLLLPPPLHTQWRALTGARAGRCAHCNKSWHPRGRSRSEGGVDTVSRVLPCRVLRSVPPSRRC